MLFLEITKTSSTNGAQVQLEMTSGKDGAIRFKEYFGCLGFSYGGQPGTNFATEISVRFSKTRTNQSERWSSSYPEQADEIQFAESLNCQLLAGSGLLHRTIAMSASRPKADVLGRRR
jgi:hypothetical protein